MPERNIVSWRQPLGEPSCPYAYRWVLNLGLFAFRVHKWIGSDDLRAHHDHPYWFITLVCKGSYADVTASGEEVLRPGCIRFRRATHLHGVKLLKGPCWTFLMTGPPLRKWGFVANGKWMRREVYFRKHGHHPCD